MSVKIRMTRMGRRHRPFFRINAIESRNPRDGRILEKLGHYDPIEKDKEKQVVLNIERTKYWLDKGAVPSDTVSQILVRYGIRTKEAAKNTAKRAKAKAIAAVKGKHFTKADRIAAEKAVEAAKEKAEAEAKAAEEKAKAAEEKAKADAKAAEEETKAEQAAETGEVAQAGEAAEAATEQAAEPVKEEVVEAVEEKTEAETVEEEKAKPEAEAVEVVEEKTQTDDEAASDETESTDEADASDEN